VYLSLLYVISDFNAGVATCCQFIVLSTKLLFTESMSSPITALSKVFKKELSSSLSAELVWETGVVNRTERIAAKKKLYARIAIVIPQATAALTITNNFFSAHRYGNGTCTTPSQAET
jgi:hypothetical protein